MENLHLQCDGHTSCSDLTQNSFTVLAAFLATAKKRSGSTDATLSSLQKKKNNTILVIVWKIPYYYYYFVIHYFYKTKNRSKK